ncbi:MAG: dephospho-CoA kinase [Parcubacteria bacterium C7867-007]|nr:MAG: dephospho-CoA kinase [Parcubacteria bacterium C7867-007]
MIIGITGSFGAGKGAVVDYLIKKKGFAYFSARAFIAEEVARQGLPVDRDTLASVANELRAEHGPTYLIQSLLQEAETSGKDSVIEALRAVAEAKCIQEEGGIVLGVDASPEIRYERAIQRASETDHVTFEKWLEQEKNEMNPGDPTKQDIFGALAISDVIIQNDGTLEELHQKVDAFLEGF